MTHIESISSLILGSPKTQSIVMSDHFHSGMESGCKSHLGRWCSIFTYSHIRHLFTNYAMTRFMLLYQNIFFRSRYILVLLGWITYLEWYVSSNNSLLSCLSLRIHTLSQNLRRPYSSTLKFDTLSFKTPSLTFSNS
jgi:hypothetical protein